MGTALRLRARGLCTVPAPAAAAIRALYRRGSGRRKTGPGQPRAVVLATGGGGSLFKWMTSEPGATSCLLEARVPYAKESLVALLAEHGRNIDGVGFCSEGMAARMAEGVKQARGDIAVEPMMKADEVANAVVHMASLPLETNVQFITIMATQMPLVGRG